MKNLQLRLTGIAPILLHSGRLSDPLTEASKELKTLTSERNKSDDIHEKIALIEWSASLYTKDGVVVIPGDNVYACLVNGAKQAKKGPKMKAGIVVDNNFPLVYDGPKDINELYKDKRFVHRCAVKIGTSKLMRTRPVFNEWSVDVSIEYNPSIVNESEVVAAAVKAGDFIGLGDWRPRYGRFRVEQI